jgi:hypothetical protein
MHSVSGQPSDLQDADNPDWAPSVKLGHDKVKECSTALDTGRYQRRVGRVTREKHMTAASALLDLGVEELAEDIPVAEEETGEASQTDLHGTTIAAMQAEIQNLLYENLTLKKELSDERTRFDVDFFKESDEKVKYYTGLADFSTLNTLYHWLEPLIPHTRASVITKFQKLILCLIKLRLNLAHMDIGQRFGINKSTASRIFLNMVDLLHERLKGVIVWPEREELRETMPMSFRVHFGCKVAIIIDCFEVFLDTPSNLGARAWTWSSYKHNNTVKFLIGITPQGSISFLSKGWVGRTSDKCLTEHCGLLRVYPGWQDSDQLKF